MKTTRRRPCPAQSGRGRDGTCDFCGAPRPVWCYPCRDFARTVELVGGVAVNYIGSWWACEACHVLIEANAWAALADRTMAAQPAETRRTLAAVWQILRSDVAGLHAMFARHRTGPAVRG